jgi:hypothetical protein
MSLSVLLAMISLATPCLLAASGTPNAAVYLGAGGTATFAALVAGTGNSAVRWSLSQSARSSSNGLYVAPATIKSAQLVTVTADNVVDRRKPQRPRPPCNQPYCPVSLPVEVMGADGTTVGVTVAVPDGANLTGQSTLWMQIHGLKYETEASVQVNSSEWLPINTANVTLEGNAAAFGGIGGGFSTLQVSMNLPAGTIGTGINTITFRFNGTDTVVSGFRVLAFNLRSDGTNLLPAAQFVTDDPNAWQPPSALASDIAAGKSLWQNAPLTGPTSSGGVQSMHAHCSDCHTEDGRDLKYFNYSNTSIEARSVFHGLTAQQGQQIASYIRSLNLPNPGRPWNPPYQPGPGLDSQSVENWSAGAGLDAVLDSDAAMLAYLAPGGSTAGWAATSYLNPRETPIDLQLLDWNSWLPQVHPTDAFSVSFTGNALNTNYSLLRNMLRPNSATAYQRSLETFVAWFGAEQNFVRLATANPNWNAKNLPAEVYSIGQWTMVKQWELNQEFGLEAMPQVPFGAKANSRGWYGGQAFQTSPRMLKIPSGFSVGHGSAAAFEYLGYVWYHTQLLLNDGQGQQRDNNPIDFAYAQNSPKDLSLLTGGSPTASLALLWSIKAVQENTLKGKGPNFSSIFGFDPTSSSPFQISIGSFVSSWSATSPSAEATLITGFVKAWLPEISSFTPAQFYAGKDGNGRPWASPAENPATDSSFATFGGMIWYMLPRLRFLGVDADLTYQVSAWAQTVWPVGNWALSNSATCSSMGKCSTDPIQ